MACSTLSYTISGELAGLLPANQTILQDNHVDDLLRRVDGKFTFTIPVAYGLKYDVTIKAFPASQERDVIDGAGKWIRIPIPSRCFASPTCYFFIFFSCYLRTCFPYIVRYFPVGLMPSQDKDFYEITTAQDITYDGNNNDTGDVFKRGENSTLRFIFLN